MLVKLECGSRCVGEKEGLRSKVGEEGNGPIYTRGLETILEAGAVAVYSVYSVYSVWLPIYCCFGPIVASYR